MRAIGFLVDKLRWPAAFLFAVEYVAKPVLLEYLRLRGGR